MPSNDLYTNDDESALLSMRDFRVKSEKRMICKNKISCWLCGPAGAMVLLGLFIGFIMGYDQAANHVLAEKQKVQTVIIGGSKYDASTTPSELLGHMRKHRKSILEKLHRDYGDFGTVLWDDATIHSIFNLTENAQIRYRRRLIQKLLQKQLAPEKRRTITWVTAGDHRASGRGNLPTDSYTEVLFDTIKDSFAAVGLEFVVKNRAFDGYGSGPALALCMETVYGADVDILSWDFATTDGDHHYRSALWGTRATLHPSQPLLMMIDSGMEGRWKQMSRMDGRLGVALMDTYALLDTVHWRFPDSSKHPAEAVKGWPRAVKYLKCNGSLEGHYFCKDYPKRNFMCNYPEGDLCRENKYLMRDTCKLKKFQTDWMPGWKDHRLKGRLLGLFLLQTLVEALVELSELTKEFNHVPAKKRAQEMLRRYLQQDEQDKFLIANSPLPDNILGKYSRNVGEELLIPLFQRPANCLLASIINDGQQLPKQRMSRYVRRRLQDMKGNSTLVVSNVPNITSLANTLHVAANATDATASAKPEPKEESATTNHLSQQSETGGEVIVNAESQADPVVKSPDNIGSSRSQESLTGRAAEQSIEQVSSTALHDTETSAVTSTPEEEKRTDGISVVDASQNERTHIETVVPEAVDIQRDPETPVDVITENIMATEGSPSVAVNAENVKTTTEAQEVVATDVQSGSNETAVSKENANEAIVVDLSVLTPPLSENQTYSQEEGTTHSGTQTE